MFVIYSIIMSSPEIYSGHSALSVWTYKETFFLQLQSWTLQMEFCIFKKLIYLNSYCLSNDHVSLVVWIQGFSWQVTWVMSWGINYSWHMFLWNFFFLSFDFDIWNFFFMFWLFHVAIWRMQDGDSLIHFWLKILKFIFDINYFLSFHIYMVNFILNISMYNLKWTHSEHLNFWVIFDVKFEMDNLWHLHFNLYLVFIWLSLYLDF